MTGIEGNALGKVLAAKDEAVRLRRPASPGHLRELEAEIGTACDEAVGRLWDRMGLEVIDVVSEPRTFGFSADALESWSLINVFDWALGEGRVLAAQSVRLVGVDAEFLVGAKVDLYDGNFEVSASLWQVPGHRILSLADVVIEPAPVQPSSMRRRWPLRWLRR